MTLTEAARRYGVPRERLKRAATRGRLAAEKIGTARTLPYLVTAEAVEQYLATARRGRPTVDATHRPGPAPRRATP